MQTYSNAYTYDSYNLVSFLLGYFLFIALILLIVWIIYSYGLSKVFKKAGFEGWAAFIPIYNEFVKYQIIFGKQKGWLSFIQYLGVITILLPVNIIISVYATYSLSKAYGKGVLFTIGLILFPFIFIFFLPNDSEYLGPQPFFGWLPFDSDKKD